MTAGSIGNLALIVCIILNIYLIFSLTTKIRKKNFKDLKKIKFINNSIFILLLVSFLTLIYCFVISDFANVAVYQNSHTTKPLLYKISGAWGNHEGSMVLFVLILSLFSFLFSNSKVNEELKIYTIFFSININPYFFNFFNFYL